MKSRTLKKSRKKLILQHLFIWTTYWCIELLLFSFAFSGVLQNRNLLFEFLMNAIFGTSFFYVLVFLIFPANTNPVKWIQVLGRIILAVLLCLLLKRGCILLMVEYINFKSAIVSNIKFFVVSSLDIFSRYGIYAALFWFFRRQGALSKQVVQQELEAEKLKHELLETKYAVLKAQINPHFLFNTLNFIHSKAIFHDDHVLDRTILLLSDVLRHALKDDMDGYLINVNLELEHIKKLSELHSLRFSGRFYLNIIEEGTDFSRKIPVLILLTFFENAIKYGVYDNPEYPIILQVVQSAQLLEISLKNKIRNVESVNNQTKFSIGKRYIKNTLEQFYKNSYILDYHDNGVYHTVHLKIYE